ncbi:nicotinate-nucleotide--dimethylbenzimidazole phosphoribosyltransferase [Deminuibacter soli]|uniref:Nicotinate-nucleotide--dimethylbenzimidazole phosphoribosyltransferase n=1 Tax=Deminuibacter soli TaxID=2291815 RepID=A0A3E1NF53_9BACT|nr:nicotinate-nucleotide--dimethylbenzimidazole phosphoribosyltransferase [Deminuibacter soli]RFM26615.1 nicotinate-nucleotide--dimethylbenzimidazole phosphoribosyltransferase [Deminuibacter soli]
MQTLQQQLQHKIDHTTKPLGSLGQLESIALQIGTIQQTLQPAITQPHIVVFAGDHGIALTGLVNPYPQAVTAQMVLNYLNGGAAINVFCKLNQVALKVVDAGVNADFDNIQHPDFIQAKINKGTANYLQQPAMTAAELQQALEKGKAIVAGIAATGCNCIGFGEMGISNTSSAALLMHAFTQLPLEACTGRGTGASDAQLQQKLATLQQAYTIHQNNLQTPQQVLQAFGGFEIAMMTGAYLEAAAQKMVIVVDGFIATTALLAALQMQPEVQQYCVFAHTSGEKGHAQLLQWLKATPLLQLGLRLGEGTGAALAVPLLRAAVAFVNEMASFESARVSTATS